MVTTFLEEFGPIFALPTLSFSNVLEMLLDPGDPLQSNQADVLSLIVCTLLNTLINSSNADETPSELQMHQPLNSLTWQQLLCAYISKSIRFRFFFF